MSQPVCCCFFTIAGMYLRQPGKEPYISAEHRASAGCRGAQALGAAHETARQLRLWQAQGQPSAATCMRWPVPGMPGSLQRLAPCGQPQCAHLGWWLRSASMMITKSPAAEGIRVQQNTEIEDGNLAMADDHRDACHSRQRTKERGACRVLAAATAAALGQQQRPLRRQQWHQQAAAAASAGQLGRGAPVACLRPCTYAVPRPSLPARGRSRILHTRRDTRRSGWARSRQRAGWHELHACYALRQSSCRFNQVRVLPLLLQVHASAAPLGAACRCAHLSSPYACCSCRTTSCVPSGLLSSITTISKSSSLGGSKEERVGSGGGGHEATAGPGKRRRRRRRLRGGGQAAPAAAPTPLTPSQTSPPAGTR